MGNLVTCKKDLYKSTYLGTAFDIDKEYEIVEETETIIFIKDNENHSFNFTKVNEFGWYKFEDYFKKI